MSSDIANVRADIKAWERKFKETNGREPTIDDIKKQPAVGASRRHSFISRRTDPRIQLRNISFTRSFLKLLQQLQAQHHDPMTRLLPLGDKRHPLRNRHQTSCDLIRA
jgi:hypothetical protein